MKEISFFVYSCVYSCCYMLLLHAVFECKGADRVIQPTGDVIAAEGDTVTLDCSFETSGTGYYLFWYKQDENNSPKFILSRPQFGTGNTEKEYEERFSSTLDSTSKSVPLKIQKLQLSDSAVYYFSENDDSETLVKRCVF
uniref:Ig-like domain-containing protein n=1 Tax=Sparus aurata TaxID=8175 RepID=A0A671U0X0_SPAAU